jgi:hypothetical protein
MARILKFRRDPPDSQGDVDSAKVWEYVIPRLDFPLPDFIAGEIDDVFEEIWNSSENDVDFYECVAALESLQEHDILIPQARRETIVSLVFEYLEQNGFLTRLE